MSKHYNDQMNRIVETQYQALKLIEQLRQEEKAANKQGHYACVIIKEYQTKIKKRSAQLTDSKMKMQAYRENFLDDKTKEQFRKMLKSGRMLPGLLREPIVGLKTVFMFYSDTKRHNTEYKALSDACNVAVANLENAINECHQHLKPLFETPSLD